MAAPSNAGTGRRNLGARRPKRIAATLVHGMWRRDIEVLELPDLLAQMVEKLERWAGIFDRQIAAHTVR